MLDLHKHQLDYLPGDLSSFPTVNDEVSPLKEPNLRLVTDGDPAIDNSSSDATLLLFGVLRPLNYNSVSIALE